ncbi:2-hydroxyacid dehydrogenase [Phreatobacter oligotrophus]|uniref:Lactate dehydrogenase-like 2-hydroxyacid dehydrogenase n=1 Tax=Phreatobacter oligotrophus TaxID=1122261 RepID=A0A2T4YYC4_9HYPH|nr:2-hydroxyacid dehydrogenase [Phreatobacter oligotrophus]PTM51745.1 lactate dehydrogenase-like 2-hydroxyacid dehydrogenase [Phreatobacter oligotrophus]
MTKPDLLMTGPMMQMIQDQLAQRFTVHKLWLAEDKEAMLRQLAPSVSAIASGSHVPCDPALMGRFPGLKIVSSFGVGYDHVDAAWAGKNGIVVTNTPDVLNEEVADTALGLLLCTVRQFPQTDRYLRAGKWLEKPYPLTGTLRDRKVGILGLGRIGKAIAKRLEAFGVPVVYHGRTEQKDVAYRYYPSLVDMAKDVNVLLIVAPGGASTHRIVNAEVLKALGPDGILINVGRGSVVDEPALIEALKAKTILSAGLDVFEDEPRVPAELIGMDHVVLFPHVGSASVHTRNAMAQLVVDNLVAFADGKGPLTPVAETPWPPQA